MVLHASAAASTTGLENRPISPTQKYLIQFGQEPTTTYVKANIKTMERVGFDGIAIGIDYTDPYYGTVHFKDRIFSSYAIDQNLLSTAIGELQTTDFNRFTENFLRINGASPGTVDWFDFGSMKGVIHNFCLAASVAFQGGLKGLFIDMEQYATKIFSYPDQLYYGTKTFAQYQAQVRFLAKMAYTAMQEIAPGIIYLDTLGYEQATQTDGADLTNLPYGLYTSWLDGKYDACYGSTTVHNMCELGFPSKTASDYTYLFGKQTTAPNCKSTNYQRIKRIGQCMWLDYGGTFDFVNFANNYHTPDSFRDTVVNGVNRVERYFWIYNQVPKWWNASGDAVPQAYLTALDEARNTLGLESTFSPTQIQGLQGYFDPSTIGVANGASIDTWNDSSGKGNHATNTGTNRPTLNTTGFGSLPGVAFASASSQYLKCDSIAAAYNGACDSPYTFMCVAKQTADTPGTQTIFAGLGTSAGNAPAKSWGVSTSSKWIARKINDAATSAQLNSTTLTTATHANVAHIFVTRHSGTLAQMRVNGTEVLAITSNTVANNCTFNQARIGCEAVATPTWFDNGLKGHILFFNTFLETPTVQKIERWLGSIYGITVA